MRAIAASENVDAPVEDVYAVLADLRRHWQLAGTWVDPLELDIDGGLVRLHGPMGIARTARTRVVDAEPPTLLSGEAQIDRTRATVAWILEPAGAGTRVTLRAEVLAAGPLDRLLLALGGRTWLRGRFRATLARLAVQARTPHAAPPVPVG